MKRAMMFILVVLALIVVGYFIVTWVVEDARVSKHREALRNGDYRARKDAVNKLVEIGKPAVNSLIAVVENENNGSETRRDAARALGRIGDKRAVAPLIEILQDTSTIAEVRGDCAVTLGRIGEERCRQPLLAVMKDEHSWVRMHAAQGLGYLGGESVIDPLIEALKDEDYYVRRWAAWSLGSLRAEKAVVPLIDALERVEKANFPRMTENALVEIGPPAVGPLTEALMDKKKGSNIRVMVAGILGQIGDHTAVAPLIDTLKDEHEMVRAKAAWALGDIGNESAHDPLLAVLKNDNFEYARAWAARGLGFIGTKDTVASLLEALEDDSDMVRLFAIGALGDVGDASAAEVLVHILTEEIPREQLENPSDPAKVMAFKRKYALRYGLRSRAAEALVKLGRGAVPVLMKLLQDKDQSANDRAKAADLLGQIGQSWAVEPLVIALSDKEKKVRNYAEFALVKIGAPAVNQLLPLLDDDDDKFCERVSKMLCRIGDKGAVEPLIDKLESGHIWAANALGWLKDKRALEPLIKELQNNKDEAFRAAAAAALGMLGSKDAIPSLVQALQNDKDASVRCKAAKALGRIGDSEAVAPLVRALGSHEYYTVRSCAAEALGEIGNKQAIGSLIEALKDGSSDVRSRAAQALGKIGDRKAVKPLIEALRDENRSVRTSAERALKDIRSK